MGFGPTYVAHIPPLRGWYSRDSLCYGVGARMAYITANAKISLSVISPHFLSFSLYTQMALRASIPPVLYSAQSLVLGPL